MYWLLLIPFAGFCFMGYLFGLISGNPVAGFLWGCGIGFVVTIAMYVDMDGRERLKAVISKNKLLIFVALGIFAGAALAASLAYSLGSASCEKYDHEARSTNCVQYDDNGFEPTPEERWKEFWKVFPTAAIIGGLIAVIVYRKTHKW